MILGVWVNPNAGIGEFDFRLDAECRSRNYTACWWILIHECRRGTDDYKKIPGYWFKTEQEAYADMGAKAIAWTKENKANHAQFSEMLSTIKRSVSEVMATFDGGGQNASPEAGADSYSTHQDTALDVPAPGLLSNDSDPDGDSIAARICAFPAHGTVTINRDGSFRYTPQAGFVGTDTFTYVADDGENDSDPATVTINVVAAEPEPEPEPRPPSEDCSECEADLAECRQMLETFKNAIQAALDAAE